MQRVAQDWLVLTIPGNGGAALGITTGLQFLPILLLSPYAGVIADRFPKRRLLQLTQATMALASLLLGVIAVLGVAETWHVYVIALAFGVGAAFDGPTRQAFVSEMVGPDDVTNAVGLNSAAFNTARIVGPALAGLLIGLLGGGMEATGWVILINAASYLAVIWQLERMDTRALHSPAPAGRRPGMLLEGLRYLRGQPKMLMILVLVFFAGTFGMNFQMTSALMATEVFGKGASEFGLLGSALAVGSLTGALLAARRPRVRVRLLFLAAIGFGVAEIVAGSLPSYLAFALVLPADRVRHDHAAQLRQRHPADRERPRAPGPGDGDLYDDRDGRDPDRRTGDRLDRRDVRRPLDADRGRTAGARRRAARPARAPDRGARTPTRRTPRRGSASPLAPRFCHAARMSSRSDYGHVRRSTASSGSPSAAPRSVARSGAASSRSSRWPTSSC